MMFLPGEKARSSPASANASAMCGTPRTIFWLKSASTRASRSSYRSFKLIFFLLFILIGWPPFRTQPSPVLTEWRHRWIVVGAWCQAHVNRHGRGSGGEDQRVKVHLAPSAQAHNQQNREQGRVRAILGDQLHLAQIDRARFGRE